MSTTASFVGVLLVMMFAEGENGNEKRVTAV